MQQWHDEQNENNKTLPLKLGHNALQITQSDTKLIFCQQHHFIHSQWHRFSYTRMVSTLLLSQCTTVAIHDVQRLPYIYCTTVAIHNVHVAIHNVQQLQYTTAAAHNEQHLQYIMYICNMQSKADSCCSPRTLSLRHGSLQGKILSKTARGGGRGESISLGNSCLFFFKDWNHETEGFSFFFTGNCCFLLNTADP